ncbi:MAG TPA: SMP-30/gluconolactonase/LRE family protein [Acidobacteriaceae bacterium]|jgi:enterochelin esterase-like enzyme|nr:SMP-30/gluconolactonase/LRE family protein [Acidobacteriaceae bacterium]
MRVLSRSTWLIKPCFFLLLAGEIFYGANVYGQAPKDTVYEPALPAVSNNYTLGPDSKLQPNVPAGKIFSFKMQDSKIFPGTTRTISVYIPAEYKSEHPACLFVELDGLSFDTPIVFDNLIAQHAMPVTIGIGVSPGEVPSSKPPENPRFDRSLEFDSLNDRLARFLLEEVIPEVERHKTPSGDAIVISADPNDHAIGGSSTGGIGAFTVAWQRPDAFRRVFIAIGTFVGMRGGERYYVQVRKTEPKPLRIFEQDGIYDEWGGGPEIGDWWMSNLTMNRALEFAGYDVKRVWGTGTHDTSQATAVFPDAMRWLWRDYPAPIRARAPGNPRLREIAVPGESWQLADVLCGKRVSVAVEPDGTIVFPRDARGVISTGAKSASCSAVDKTAVEQAFSVGRDGRRYEALAGGGIRISAASGSSERIVARGLSIRGLTVSANGDLYATTFGGTTGGELWLIRDNGEVTKLDEGLKGASGVALSPDGLWLFVTQSLSHQGLSYRVQADGKVDSREPLYEFYVPDTADDSGAEGIAMDKNGWAYVATRMGIQVFDRNGRVIIILPLPDNEAATGVTFGGANFDILYVAAEGGKIYKRKLKIAGVPSFAPRVTLPKWGDG